MMGYGELPDLIENGDDAESFDVSSVCKRFPSIIVGSSPPVVLYDENMDLSEIEGVLTTTNDNVDLVSKSTSEYKSTPKDVRKPPDSSDLSSTSSSRSQSSYMRRMPSDEKILNQTVAPKKESSLLEPPREEDATPLELILDRPISCVTGLTKRQLRQLEEVGFHTVRFREKLCERGTILEKRLDILWSFFLVPV